MLGQKILNNKISLTLQEDIESMGAPDQKYSCIIVDDERPALELMEAYIQKMPYLRLVKKCQNPLEAINVLTTERIDIMALDIEMPAFTGMELIKSIKNPPEVIISTAYRKYALEGFDLNVSDYILKPYSLNRFSAAISKCIENIKLKRGINMQEINTSPPTDHFYIKTNNKLKRVKFLDILYIESMKEYVCVYTQKGRSVVNMSMKSMLLQLPSSSFQRIHRSYIINKDHIVTIRGNEVMIGDKSLLIGGSYREAFFNTIHSI